MILLEVPYSQKDIVKSLGAKWLPEHKKWAATNKSSYEKFLPWLTKDDIFNGPYEGDINIACDNVFIVEGHKKCFKCSNDTRVIGFAYDCMLQIYVDFIDTGEGSITVSKDFELNIMPPDSNMPNYIIDIAKRHFNYHNSYSKTTRSKYLANNCDICNSLQGDFFLFHEVDSPFFIKDTNDAKKLVLHKIPLKFDFVLNGDLSWNSESHLIRKYAKKSNQILT